MPEIGSTVSRYKILAELGSGGMSVVYEAEDLELGRRVAIKFLPEAAASTPDAFERFRREARAASALNHPHICMVLDAGTHAGKPFLVMELLSGRTLRQELGDGALRIERVLLLGEQIADALDTAHRAGIVHRDLKPANLFVTERGEAKVLDFGLAKMGVPTVGRSGIADAPTVADELLTDAGTAVGTVAYMSPEQARGQTVDARSDLFSLGVVLYEMATGKLPFQGESVAEFFASILRSDPVPPRELNHEIPQRLEEIILKTLEKDAARRYLSAADLRSDLLRLRSDSSAKTPAAARSESSGESGYGSKAPAASQPRRRVAIGAALAAVLALAAAGFLVQRANRPTPYAGPDGGEAAGARGVGGQVPPFSIAVLPFLNMSPEAQQDFFSDGISEELLNLLASIPELRVTSRTSAFSFKGQKLEIPEIASRLHVAYVLEGSVRRSQGRVRVAAQLIDAATDTHVWSQIYDRELVDVFAIQDEIAADVVKQLKVTLLGAAPKTRKTDPEAYALYLQARELGRRFTAEAFERSDAQLRRVLEIDPSYAPAWDALARNLGNEAGLGLVPFEQGFGRAHEAATRAVEVDPRYAPAYASLGYLAMYDENDLAAAARRFEQALALDPADPSVLANSASLLGFLGRLDEALALEQIVVERDPVNVTHHFSLGISQRWAGRYADAVASFEQALKLSPDLSGARYQLAVTRLLQRNPAAALEQIQRESSEVWRTIGLPMVYSALGRETDADAALLEATTKYGKDGPFNIASVYAFRGQADLAFAWLERAVSLGDPGLGELVTENLFDRVRSDRRWLPLLRKLGKAPEQLAEIEFHVALPR